MSPLSDDGPAFHYTATGLAMEGARRKGLPLQACVGAGVAVEAGCFLVVCNFDSEARNAKLLELQHDIITAVGRPDFDTGMLLTHEGKGRIGLHVSSDPDQLAAMASAAEEADHGFIPIIPARLAAWCIEREALSHAVRH